MGTVGKVSRIETNLYGYSFSDPINYIDPKGTTAYFVCVANARAGCVRAAAERTANSCAGKGESFVQGLINHGAGDVLGSVNCLMNAANACAESMYNMDGPIIPDQGT